MYNLLLRFIYLYIHIPWTGHNNRNKWLLAQKNIFKSLKINKEKCIWIHCASLGEYEYVKPLIPELKRINPLITITFFSPSGYENFKDFDLIDQISYLPFDIKRNIVKFTNTINPMMVLVAKNEIWPNMINCLEQKKIPLFLIGFKIKKDKIKNWLIKKYYMNYVPKFRHIFCQDKFTYTFLNLNNVSQLSIIEDTRINQVLNDAKKSLDDKLIQSFTKNKKKTIIYGSIEEEDYKIIIDFIVSRNDLNHIIIPHEMSQIQNLKKTLPSKSLIYSDKKNDQITDSNILIVDVFGILKHIYKYSDIAYIGGGFSQGVHNTLEPAAYGNYMLFGPKHTHFPETYFFIENQVSSVINSKQEFEEKVHKYIIQGPSKESVFNTTQKFLNKNTQDVDVIINHIKKHLT